MSKRLTGSREEFEAWIRDTIGGEAVITVMARPNAKLGLVFLEMRRAVENLEKLI